MPELGKATYRLVIDTSAAAPEMEATEAQVTQMTAKVGQQLTLVDESFGKVGAAAGAAAVEVGAASGEIAAEAGAAGAASQAAGEKAALGWSKATTAIKEHGKVGGQMGTLLGLGAAYFAIHGGIEWLKDSNAGWLQVKNSIMATGQVAGVTAGHASELADKWERLTGAARGETLQTESLLLRFKNIRNVGPGIASVFDRTLTQIENIHAATGRSIQAITAQVGKAIQDPSKYLGLLGRAGITFTKVQQDMVKKLALTKGTLAAQMYVLDQLDQRYRHAAETQGKTFVGQLKIAKAEVDANSAAILTVLIPSFVQLVSVIKGVTDVMRGHKELLKNAILIYVGFRVVLFGARTAIIAVETAMKIANAMTMTLGGTTRAATTATKALGDAELATAGKTETMGAASATAAGEIDVATASTKSFRLSTIAAGTTLGGLLGPLAIAAAAYATLSYFAGQAASAVANLDAASAHEGGNRVAELSYYAETYKNNIKRGMSPAKAKAAAIAATNKHAKMVGLPAFDVHNAGGEDTPWAKAPPKVIAGKKPKKKHGKALIPVDFQIQQAQAQLTASLTDDETAYADELAFLKNLLKTRKLSKADELTVLQEMVAVNSSLTSIQSQLASKAKAAAAKRKREAAAAWKALLNPIGLTSAFLKAERTKTLKDDEKALAGLKAYYQRLLEQQTKGSKAWEDVQKKLTQVAKQQAAVQKREAAARKKARDEYVKGLKMEQAALDMRGTFFGQFASDIFHKTPDGLKLGGVTGPRVNAGHKTVTVHQTNNYAEIPRDRHETARKMRLATEGAMG